jgi:hypothetical protein
LSFMSCRWSSQSLRESATEVVFASAQETADRQRQRIKQATRNPGIAKIY